MTVAGFLVWRRALKGFAAEKWPASYMPPADQEPPLARHPLGTEEFALRIAILEARYPPPKPPEDPAPAPKPEPPTPNAPQAATVAA